GQHIHSGLGQGVLGVAVQQGGEHCGVRGAVGAVVGQLHTVALGGQADECAGVGEVAVVAQGQRARGGGAESGLSVLPGAGAGGGVAGVPQGDVPGQGAERDVVEDLGDQPHVLVDEDLLPVAGGDPGGLLAAVLQSVQPEVG